MCPPANSGNPGTNHGMSIKQRDTQATCNLRREGRVSHARHGMPADPGSEVFLPCRCLLGCPHRRPFPMKPAIVDFPHNGAVSSMLRCVRGAASSVSGATLTRDHGQSVLFRTQVAAPPVVGKVGNRVCSRVGNPATACHAQPEFDARRSRPQPVLLITL